MRILRAFREGVPPPDCPFSANFGPFMSKRTSAKYKLDRRMGESVWGRPKSPVNKRS